jgi:hypothetical protein
VVENHESSSQESELEGCGKPSICMLHIGQAFAETMQRNRRQQDAGRLIHPRMRIYLSIVWLHVYFGVILNILTVLAITLFAKLKQKLSLSNTPSSGRKPRQTTLFLYRSQDCSSLVNFISARSKSCGNLIERGEALWTPPSLPRLDISNICHIRSEEVFQRA